MNRYYISWHATSGAILTRYFPTKEERETFRKLIDCESARVEVWQEEKHVCESGITSFCLSFS